MSAPNHNPAARLESVDLLRGLAALAVMALHIPHEAPGGWREHPFFFLAYFAEFGYLGVPLFVLISGFCIHRRAALQQHRTGTMSIEWRSFWFRRFFRLYPPYLAAIAFSLACAAWGHSRYPHLWDLIRYDVATHVVMVHNLTERFCGGLGNGAFWSLGMEEQLYGLYALLALMMVRWGRGTAIAVAAVATILWRVAVAWFPARFGLPEPLELGAWHLWPFHFWLLWTLGAASMDAHAGNMKLASGWRSPIAFCAASIVGAALNKHTLDLLSRTGGFGPLLADRWGGGSPGIMAVIHVGELAFGVAFFILMNWCVSQESRRWMSSRPARALASIGRMSYSLYLVHVPVIYTLEEHWSFGHSPRDWLLRYAVYGTTCLVVGFVFFQLVERWFLEPWGKRPAVAAASTNTVSPELTKPVADSASRSI